jgi:type IV secretion system protein VirB5
MKFCKALIRAALGALLLVTAVGAKAQIPTTDIVAAGQRLTEITNTIKQLEQMKNQVTALTGNSGVGLSLNNPALHNYLPDQWESIYSKVQSGSLTGLSSATQQIMQQEGLGNAPTAGSQRINNTLATNKAMAQTAYDASISRLTNIQNLMSQSNTTQNAAQKADLNNRLQAELANVQTEQSRLNVMTTLQNAETALAQRQTHLTNKNALLGVDSSGNLLSTGTTSTLLGQ